MKLLLAAAMATIALFAVYEHTNAQDCGGHVLWQLHLCPTGDGWECWRQQKRRDINCGEYGWGNKTDFANSRGFGWCYCCGRCRVPENLYAV